MISLTSKGDWGSTIKQLKRMATSEGQYANLDKYGKAGVAALARATPVDTGLTADSWKYKIVKTRGRPGIEWYNTNVVNGTSVAILIQYGHGTGTGGYVRGKDYINPAMRPVFDQIVSQFFREVSSWRR
jgi:Bacteriophage HK97-gp10, putative tail-component